MVLSQFSGNNSNRANTAFMIGLFTILGALCFEYIGGYLPCELCLEQRLPYYIGLPVLAVVIGAWKVMPVMLRIGLTFAVALLFLWSTYLGAFHAGVEWGFWPGPTACTGTGTGEGISFDDLGDINANRVVQCDAVQLRILGISLAGYNALISLLISALLFWSVGGQWKRLKG